MKTISLKVPAALDAKLRAMAKRQATTKSVLVRSALEAYLQNGQNGAKQAGVSCLDLVGDLAGCLDGGFTDLSTNPKHMEGFGK